MRLSKPCLPSLTDMHCRLGRHHCGQEHAAGFHCSARCVTAQSSKHAHCYPEALPWGIIKEVAPHFQALV